MGKILSTQQVGGKTKQITAEHELIFWQHSRDIAVPNDVWTPFPWDLARVNLGEGVPWGLLAPPSDVSTFTPAQTTCTGIQALPQATINVADTSQFLTAGYATIRANSLGGAETIVKYTGKTATTLTGCTGGTGTTAAADVVRQANVTPERLGFGGSATVEVAWAHHATGVRGVRFRFMDGAFNLAGGTDVRSAAAAASPNALMRNQSTEQPINIGQIPSANVGLIVEVYQNSGGVLNCVSIPTELSAPRLVIMNLSPTDISTIS